MMTLSRLDCPLSLKTPNMGNTGLLSEDMCKLSSCTFHTLCQAISLYKSPHE